MLLRVKTTKVFLVEGKCTEEILFLLKIQKIRALSDYFGLSICGTDEGGNFFSLGSFS